MKPPFNPWPLGVILALVLFGAGTAGLVVLACSQRSDLVRADYYDQEIRHQEQMNRVARTRRAAPDARATYDAHQQSISLSLPALHAQLVPQGQILLYRPSAANLDRRYPLDLDAAGTQQLDARELPPGLWQVQVSWIADQEEYFYSQKLVVNPNH
jgi:nitrogen fixation protein FixH